MPLDKTVAQSVKSKMINFMILPSFIFNAD